MVTFFEVITFFGVATFFAWLEFLTLLNDLASEIQSRTLLSPKQVRDSLVATSDRLFASFVLYAVAVVADYLYHNAVRIGTIFVVSFLHELWLIIVVLAACFIGTIIFLATVWRIRSILKGDKDF